MIFFLVKIIFTKKNLPVGFFFAIGSDMYVVIWRRIFIFLSTGYNKIAIKIKLEVKLREIIPYNDML